ncbi:hypothetical protein QTO34_003275 [Cnephaeus nilssonii]|uniref:Fibronectin type-III domain-containing protein n=1 Tax=Cnephaeus nilssonii TaxID=3371016 RepID=A0AA40LL66_CNENI|nr:hypothetical protein QTO34_003275 [Eptesicus nilssonii]
MVVAHSTATATTTPAATATATVVMATATMDLRDWLFLCYGLIAFLTEVIDSTTCPSVCRCDNGFIYCNDRGLTAIPADIPDGATTLYLQNNQINNAGIPQGLKAKVSVQVIYLYDNALDEFPVNLPRSLRELHLQDNNVRAIARASLARLPLLEKLHLDDNSVSTVSIEEDAFADSRQLKLLFLSRNHLSSIPSGLPRTLEELRLDDNRISTIPLHAFKGLHSLRRLVLDGNLLANQRIADDTFSRLQNLTELSLVRNSLAAPPLNLPSAHLQKLYLQDNAISHIPYNTLAKMRSWSAWTCPTTTSPRCPAACFDDLENLAQLLLRNNPWFCGCNLMWLRDWGPEKVRGMAIKDITSEMDACFEAAPQGGAAHAAAKTTAGNQASATTPQGSLFTLKAKRPGLRLPDSSLDYPLATGEGAKTLVLHVKPLTADSIRITWKATLPAASFRLSWLRLGHSPAVGSITETLVQGDKTEYLLTALEPKSTYIICMVTMETATPTWPMRRPCVPRRRRPTATAPPPPSTRSRTPTPWPPCPWRASLGARWRCLALPGPGGPLLVRAPRGDLLTRERAYPRGSQKKGSYLESGTKKDNSILEIRGPGLQMLPINPYRAKEEYVVHTIFPSNGSSLARARTPSATAPRGATVAAASPT